MPETPEYIHAEKAALRLIARAEQCSVGLSRKLEKRGHDEIIVRQVIAQLTEENLLNDSRYAQFWLRSRLPFARSPMRLLSSLCAKGIDHDEAQAALKTVLNEETELTLISRYAKKAKGRSGNGTQTLKFMLKNEGFSHQAIQKFLEI